MSLTAAQITDVRRYMGYSAVGTTQPINDNTDIVYGRFGMTTMSLFTRLTTLTATEETVLVNTYLTNLAALETAIPAASANLDTDQASVWYHNKREVQDREMLFNAWSRRMCAFLGFPPGPGLSGGNNVPVLRA